MIGGYFMCIYIADKTVSRVFLMFPTLKQTIIKIAKTYYLFGSKEMKWKGKDHFLWKNNIYSHFFHANRLHRRFWGLEH